MSARLAAQLFYKQEGLELPYNILIVYAQCVSRSSESILKLSWIPFVLIYWF